jgi:hypothetical protein
MENRNWKMEIWMGQVDGEAQLPVRGEAKDKDNAEAQRSLRFAEEEESTTEYTEGTGKCAVRARNARELR